MSKVRSDSLEPFRASRVSILRGAFGGKPVFDVTHSAYGAAGDWSIAEEDGTDDTEAIQAAIDDAYGSAEGGIVLLPPGHVYMISEPLVMRRSVVLWGMPGSANFYGDVKGATIAVTDKTITAVQFAVDTATPAIGAGIYGVQIWGPAGNTIAGLDGTYTGSAVVIGNRTDDEGDDGVFLDHVNISGFGTGVKIHRPNNFFRSLDVSTCNTDIHVEGTDPITDAFGVRGNEFMGCNLHAAKNYIFYAEDATELMISTGVFGSTDSGLGIYFKNVHRSTVTGVTLRICNGGATVTLDNSYHNSFTGVMNYGYAGFNPGLTKTHGYHFKNGSAYNRVTGGEIVRHRQHGVYVEGSCPLNTLDGVDIIDNGLHAYNNDTPETAPTSGNGYDGVRFATASSGGWKVIGATFANTTTYDGVLPQRYAMRTPGGVLANGLVCCDNVADNLGEGVTDGFIGASPRVENNSPDFWTRSSPPASGSWNVGDFVLNADRGQVGAARGWRCIGSGTPGTWAADNIQPGVAIKGDEAATLTGGSSAPTQIWGTALTADRAVTLSTTNVVQGYGFLIVRNASATGAFSLNIGTGPLKALGAASTWARVEYNGSAWALVASGAL